MDDVIKLLAQADTQLDTIAVRGQDVFAMRNARAALKMAFDRLRKEAEHGTDSDLSE